MKKIFSAIVLAVTLLCSSISVMAADKDVKPQSVIDPLAIATGAIPLNVDGRSGSRTEYRFNAKDLHYELRNGNNAIVKSGNLGDLAESTSLFIIDWYTTYKSDVSIPFGYYFVIYPEGESGFTINYNQLYLTYCEFGYSTGTGMVGMEPVGNGLSGYNWLESFTGSYSGLHYGSHPDSSVKYRLRVLNSSLDQMTVMRLNLVLYDVYQ